jgi:prepilin-type N-terminal cleavage/methylation domain-containing protein
MSRTILHNKGFTLIEIIVALGIFVVMLQIVAFTYRRFVTVERQSIGQQEMQEDMRLFLQLFNREARTAFGNTYQAVIIPPGIIGSGIVFRNQEGRCVRYAHEVTADTQFITRSEALPATDANCADLNLYNTANTRRLTDIENTFVEELNFHAVSAQPPFSVPAVTQLTQQGFITVRMRMRARAEQNEGTRLQSTITSLQTLPYTP